MPESETGQKAAAAADDAKAAGQRVTTAVKDTVDDVKSRVTGAAGQLGDEARDRVDTVRNSVADDVDNVASALQKAKSDLRDGSPQARALGEIAEGIGAAARALRQHDLNDVLGELRGFRAVEPGHVLGRRGVAGFRRDALRHGQRAGQPDDGAR